MGMFQDTVGSFSELSCEAGSFSCCCNPYRFLGFIFLAGILSCMVCLAPQLFLSVYLYVNVGPPSPQLPPHPVLQLVHCHASSPPGCLSPPLLPGWVSISSLIPWLSDFHTVRFSVSSCWFLFLNLLLSFCLCKESQCVYLHLHLGWKTFHVLFCISYIKNTVKQTDSCKRGGWEEGQ